MSYERTDGLDVRLDGVVLRLTIDRAKKKNALDDHVMDAMVEQLETASQDEAVRVIVLAGAGDDFCSGADLVARNAPKEQRPRVGSVQRRLPLQAHRLVPLLLSIQTPVVCAVQGWVVGVGLHLALAADFCIAARSARLWEPFLSRGFTPDSGGTWLLPRIAGVARARELLLLGREISGEEAADWGLVHRVVDDAELGPAAEELVARLASAPTVAYGLTKWLIARGAGLDIDRHLHEEAFALELSSRSEDFREGLAAFRDKRDPDFTGR